MSNLTLPLTVPLSQKLRDAVNIALYGSAFTPRSLFGASDQGVWYDFDDGMDTKLQWCIDNPGYTNATFLAQFPNHTLFQDSAGTTAVTAVEQVIGKVLDKSGNGNHRTQATTGFKPKWTARKNLLLATATMSTQNITSVATPYTISHTGTGTITLSGTSTAGPLVGAGSLTFTPTAGTLTMTVSGTVSNAQLEYGSTATTYQSVVTATDYNAIGFPKGCKYDGIDDGMTTASVDFTATDKMSVCVGLTKLSDAASGAHMGLGDISVSAGSFELRSNTGAGQSNYYTALKGNSGVGGWIQAPYSAPITSITSYSYDLANTGGSGENKLTARIDGATVASTWDTGNAGTGNFGNHALRFGNRGGVSLYFTGVEHNTTIINRPLTASELTNIETFNATKTGVTI